MHELEALEILCGTSNPNVVAPARFGASMLSFPAGAHWMWGLPLI